MKKVIGILVTVLMLGTALVGCTSNNDSANNGNNGNNGNNNATVELKDGAKLSDIVAKVDEEIGVQMSADITDAELTDLFYVNKDDIEEYSGKFSMVMTSSDNFIAIKAKAGKVDAVKAALEQRKETVSKQFEQYLQDQYIKAKAGKVIVKGDYVFLAILGDTMMPDDKEFDTEAADAVMKKIEDTINSFFK